jgi:hypothetical protein
MKSLALFAILFGASEGGTIGANPSRDLLILTA